jgi:hypothetical protein
MGTACKPSWSGTSRLNATNCARHTALPPLASCGTVRIFQSAPFFVIDFCAIVSSWCHPIAADVTPSFIYNSCGVYADIMWMGAPMVHQTKQNTLPMRQNCAVLASPDCVIAWTSLILSVAISISLPFRNPSLYGVTNDSHTCCGRQGAPVDGSNRRTANYITKSEVFHAQRQLHSRGVPLHCLMAPFDSCFVRFFVWRTIAVDALAHTRCKGGFAGVQTPAILVSKGLH